MKYFDKKRLTEFLSGNECCQATRSSLNVCSAARQNPCYVCIISKRETILRLVTILSRATKFNEICWKFKILKSINILSEWICSAPLLRCGPGIFKNPLQHLKGDGVVHLFWSNLIIRLFENILKIIFNVRFVCRSNAIISRVEWISDPVCLGTFLFTKFHFEMRSKIFTFR